MNSNKALICTILFTIIVGSIIIVSMFVEPYKSEISLFHYFCPVITGRWFGERVVKFYYWLGRNNK